MSAGPPLASHDLAPLLTTDRPIPARPVLLVGPASAAILGADGSFSLPWDTRGAPIDWGGVYAQGVRLTGPWSVGVGPAGRETPLGPGTLRSLSAWRWRSLATHRVSGIEVLDELLALADASGVGRRLSLRASEPDLETARVVADIPLWLGPVLIEGVRPIEFEMRTSGASVFARSHSWALAIDSDPLPSLLAIDGRPWIGGGWTGEARNVRLSFDVPFSAERTAALDWVLWGGLGRTVDADPDRGRAALDARAGWRARTEEPWQAWEANLPHMETPEDPGLSDGFRLAAGALRSLYTDPEAEIAGLVAGYPWYSALWFRDIAWMLPAVLWLGDVDRVVRTLRTAFRFQAPADLALLGATSGEIPMQLSPGPVFLFGTSDTTLYYPGLVRRLLGHTGQPELAAPFRSGVARALAWGNSKVEPATGLITNGGEVARIRKAAGDVGRVHYGIDAFDTTIWDSADRRDHAIDVQVLWHEALEATADLEEIFGGTSAADLRLRAEAVQRTVASSYGWPSERYLYDSRHRDGSPVPKVRPNALRAVEAGYFDPATARALVERAGEDDLTTGWGLRTLSSRDPAYDPLAYHEGQVWPIATAWAAGAAFQAGDPDRGVRCLDILAGRIRAEGGYANECYRGDRSEPFDSCFLLGFSVAPFLSAVFERLWGLQPLLHRRTIGCRPNFPRTWNSATLEGVRMGPGRLSLTYRPGAVQARWDGPWAVTLSGERSSVRLEPSVPGILALAGAAPT